MHEFTGNIRDWEGWDGRIRGSNRQATEGIYYYIINVVIAYEYFEENDKKGKRIKKYGKKQQNGFVYLFRGDIDACD